MIYRDVASANSVRVEGVVGLVGEKSGGLQSGGTYE